MRKSIFMRIIAVLLLLCLGGCASEKEKTEKLTQMQSQSLAMLNYLTVLTQELTEANSDQLFLETAYLRLFNNTLPEAVDERTQDQLRALTSSLESFRMLTVKRDRIHQVYEKNMAYVIETQLPDPSELLSGLGDVDLGWIKNEKMQSVLSVTASLASMTMGALQTDQMDEHDVEMQYLQDGWELDDAVATALHNARQSAFDYMLDMSREYELPSQYTMTEKTVKEFVSWKNDSNLTGRIQFLESNKETYRLLGDYWLVLAESYYDNLQYDKCVDAVDEYKAIKAQIFHKDYGYAEILPLYIVSAREIGDMMAYQKIAVESLPQILENTDGNDWVARYFVTQTYIDLYQITQEENYLVNAYDVMLDLVNVLAAEQRQYNATYMADVEKVQVGEGASGEKKDEAAQYNKMLEKIRTAELPPISEPLRVCGEMLFSLAEQRGVSDGEKQKIANLLHYNGEDLFYNLKLDNAFRFSADPTDPAVADLPFGCEEGAVKIPVVLLTQNSCVRVSVVNKDKTTVFEDWTLKKVERNGENVTEFQAVYTSPKAEEFDYKDGMTLRIEVYEDAQAQSPEYTAEYQVKVDTTLWVFDSVSFKRVA